MEHDLVLRGKVVGPDGIEESEIGVDDGEISRVGRSTLKGSRVIDAGRCLIFPGFIDIHVHLREPGQEYEEDFRSGTEAAIHGGVTTVVDMPNNPVPAITQAAVLEKRRLSAKALVDVRFYAGVRQESLAEVERTAKLVVGYKIYLAQSTGGLVYPWERLPEAFARIVETGLPVSIHCEDQGIIDKRAGSLAGVDRPDVFADVRPPESEVASVRNVVAALGSAGRLRVNVCHASTQETLELVERTRSEGMAIDCEAALHHLFFNRRSMLTNRLLRTNPPLRDEDDRAALVRGLDDGRVSFLVTDHAPHTREGKESEGLSGVPGLDDYAHVVSWLVKRQGVSPSSICRTACLNPARFAGLNDRGEIAAGKRANFTVLDLGSPEKVRSDAIRSKCGWSPYEGFEFPGRAKWVVFDGEPVLDTYEQVT